MSTKKHRHTRRKPQQPTRLIKGVHYGKRRIRIPDPTALTVSFIVVVLTAALAALSNHYGFDKKWYGDLLTTADCVLCLFAVLNIGYVLMEGICIENGIAFLGVDSERQGIVFSYRELLKIRLLDAAGEEISTDFRVVRNADIEFVLRDGSTKVFHAKHLTARKYRAVLAYFENENRSN